MQVIVHFQLNASRLHQCDDNKERQTALTYIIVVVHALQIPDLPYVLNVYVYLECTTL